MAEVSIKPRSSIVTTEPAEEAAPKDPFESLGIKPLEDLTEYVRVLITGFTGSGKTVLAASAAAVEEMLPVLFVNADAGTVSIPKKSKIEVMKVETPQHIQLLTRALRLTRSEPRYKTIIIDDGVEFLRIVMGGVLAEQAGGNHDPDIPNRADYLRHQERSRVLLRFFRDYPANLIITAKVKDKEDDTGAQILTPAFPGVLALEFPGYFDVVGFLQVMREKEDQEPTRRFVLVPVRKVQWLKDRTDPTGKRQYIESPKMKDIYGNFRKWRDDIE